MRNVTVLQKGVLPKSEIDRQVLSCWMINNDYPNTLDSRGSTGNASDATVVWTIQQQDCAVITMSRMMTIAINKFPALGSMNRTEYTDEQCRAMYNEVYRK